MARSRRLLDLDADPVSISSQLAQDGPLAPLVRERPGLRVPGCVDGFELGVRAIVGQQVSVPAARTVLGRLVAAYGEPLPEPEGRLTHRFPSAAALAEADPAALPFPRARARALGSLARLSADGELRLDAGTDAAEALEHAHRASPASARGRRRTWRCGRSATRTSSCRETWASGTRSRGSTHQSPTRTGGPWRSYAVMHLWRSLAA